MRTRRSLRRAAPVAVVLMGASIARGTNLARVDVVCPVCDHAFEAVVVRSTNNSEGVTRDLFARAVGPQPVFYLVHTCTRCFYSGYLDDFQEPGRVSAALREKIVARPRLKPATPIARDADQRDIPAATRYALAAQIYAWRDAPAEARAWLHLRWAWVVRDDGAHLPPNYAFMQAMREVESRLPEPRPGGNQADRELEAVNLLVADLYEARFPPDIEPCVRLVIAMLLRRHGENRQALPILHELLESGRLTDPLPSGVRRMIDSIDEENRRLAEAREHFELALLRGEIKPENTAAAHYLLGEINRRLGDDAAALRWYDCATGDESLDPLLRDWARRQREYVSPIDWLPRAP